jgi:hypothetical protein
VISLLSILFNFFKHNIFGSDLFLFGVKELGCYSVEPFDTWMHRCRNTTSTTQLSLLEQALIPGCTDVGTQLVLSNISLCQIIATVPSHK